MSTPGQARTDDSRIKSPLLYQLSYGGNSKRVEQSGPIVQTSSLPANFAGKYQRRENGCWQWTAATQTNGYGSVCIGDGKTALAHRVAYEACIGPIPDGLTIDHLCRNKPCINPAHMEVVTREENSLRGAAAISPTSPFYPCGHPRTEENTRTRKQRRGNGINRECRECNRIYLREYRARKHAAA